MSMDQQLSQFSDVTVGANLYMALGLNPAETTIPENFSKVKAIAEYLNGHPDPHWLVNHLSRKNMSGMKPLDFFHSYVSLQGDKSSHIREIERLDKELKYYD